MSKPLSTNNNRRQSEEAILDADPKEVKIDPCTALTNAILVLSVSSALMISHFLVTSHCSEFRLDDLYISWPYKVEQVNFKAEVTVCFLIGVISLATHAILRPRKEDHLIINVGHRHWCTWRTTKFRVLYNGYYLSLGFLVAIMFMGVIKHNSGELRPCFLAACQPNMTLVEIITDGSKGVLLDRRVCLNQNIDYYCRSFFSGHTMTAFYAATTSCLLLMKVHGAGQRFFSLRLLISTLLFSAAAWVGTSRLQDHRHHVIDVLVGALVGTLLPVWVVAVPLRGLQGEMGLGPANHKDISRA